MFRKKPPAPPPEPRDPFPRPTPEQAAAQVAMLASLGGAGGVRHALDQLLVASGIPDDLDKRQRWYLDNPRILETPWTWLDRATEVAEEVDDARTALGAFAFALYVATTVLPQARGTTDLIDIGVGPIPAPIWQRLRDRARSLGPRLPADTPVAGDGTASLTAGDVTAWATGAGDEPDG